MALRYGGEGTVAKLDVTGGQIGDYTAWATATAYTFGDVVKGKASGQTMNVFRALLSHTSATTNEPGAGTNASVYWAQVFPGYIEGFKNYVINIESTPIDASALDDNYTLSEKISATGSFDILHEKGGAVVQKLLRHGVAGVLTVYNGGQKTGNLIDTMQCTIAGRNKNITRGAAVMSSFSFTVQGDVQETYGA